MSTKTESVTEAVATVVETSKKETEGLVATFIELGFAWAAYGLKLATTAVEKTVRVLGETAKSLDKLADELAAKSGSSAKEAATK